MRMIYIALASALALAATPALAAQDEPKPGAQNPPDQDESNAIIVTGTRAAGRTVATSAAPIDVIGNQTLTQTGQTNLLEALSTTLPSFNLPALVQPDLGSMVRAGQLRNLDPAYTLVLVNGKRRHTTAVVNEDGFPGSVATDLALIPTAAIDHIEVLRDGASALYGSDAIAGVINIILKDKPGGSISGQIGSTYRGDGTNGYVRLDYGFRLGERGFLNLAGEYNRQSSLVRNFALIPGYLSYPAVDGSGNLVPLGPGNTLPSGDSANPKEATRNNNPWRNIGVPDSTLYTASANFGYELTDAVQFYAFGTYAHRTAAAAENFRLPNTVFSNNPGLLTVYPDGFTPYETIREDDVSVTGGFKGTVSGWNWDLSATWGQDHIDVGVIDSANYALTYPGGPTDFYIGKRVYDRFTGNLDVSRSLPAAFLADPVDLSFGLEYSHEHQLFGPGEPNSYIGNTGGSSSLTGYLPADASSTGRDSYAAYLGLSFKPVKPWTLDLAGRFEHYSDFGADWSGRLSTRYDLGKGFAVRGTVSNGFHAPSLITEAYSNTSDHNGATYALVNPTSTVGRALGAEPLKPERSRNYTVGLTFTPDPHLHFALDLYEIDIDNRIGISPSIGVDNSSGTAVDGNGTPLTPAQVAQINTLLTGAGLTVGQGLVAHYFTNVGNTSTQGIDLTADGDARFGGGHFIWTAALNLNRTKVTAVAPIPAELQGLPNLDMLAAATVYDLRYRSPGDKEIVSLNYILGRWSFYLRETRYGPLKRFNGVTGGSYNIDPAFVTDISIGYDFTRTINLTVGANNLFNVYPSTIPASAIPFYQSQFTAIYDNSGPLGVVGGYYFARATVKF